MQTETTELRKITVNVPANLLEDAQNYTGDGITQTITAGLERLASSRTYQQLLALKGSGQLAIDLDDLREDRID